MPPLHSQLHLAELMASLPLASDLGHPMEVVMVSYLLSLRLGELLGLSEDELREVYYSAL